MERQKTMQLVPDWNKHYTAEAFEKDLKIKFNGPGLYLSAHDTLILIPLPPHRAATRRTVWNIKQPKETIYQCCVYNTSLDKTIFAVIDIAPIRMDTR
jgi:hypothetical protein